MEKDKIENPQAFPESCTDTGHKPNVAPGMSLRDYFAAKVIQGISSVPNTGITLEGAAKMAYQTADAMLKERTKNKH